MSIYALCGSICLNGGTQRAATTRASFLAGKGVEYLIRVEPDSNSRTGQFSIEIYEGLVP